MEVMIDIETKSTRPNAHILTIAAIKFNMFAAPSELKDMDTFYRRIESKSCIDAGLVTDSATMTWWNKQDSKIRYEAFEQTPRYPLKTVLEELNKWLGTETVYVWCRGINFDPVVLEESYRAVGLKVPWNFWNLRDVRTLLDVAQITKADLPMLNTHNALYDCYRDVIGVKKAMKKIKLI